MPAEAMDAWLRSGRMARVHGTLFRPLEHHKLKGVPLSIQRGQAEAFFLGEETGTRQILKKFHRGHLFDRTYLEGVTSVLPSEVGFAAGTQRHVLQPSALSRKWGCYYSGMLANWLDGTVLMPVIPGQDWASVADDLRSGALQLGPTQRLTLCRNLCALIGQLETALCSHRDLSSGNVFVEPETGSVSLIDFDSLYHPQLSMPAGTTGGTVGYTAPFVWNNGTLDARASWCLHADRFALGLLVLEFLVLDESCPLTSDGGMFDQDELYARSGPGLQDIARKLNAQFPEAIPMFEASLASMSFDDCPWPEDWIRVLATVNPASQSSRGRSKPMAPAVRQPGAAQAADQDLSAAIPHLSDIPVPVLGLPAAHVPVVALLSDPWKE